MGHLGQHPASEAEWALQVRNVSMLIHPTFWKAFFLGLSEEMSDPATTLACKTTWLLLSRPLGACFPCCLENCWFGEFASGCCLYPSLLGHDPFAPT